MLMISKLRRFSVYSVHLYELHFYEFHARKISRDTQEVMQSAMCLHSLRGSFRGCLEESSQSYHEAIVIRRS